MSSILHESNSFHYVTKHAMSSNLVIKQMASGELVVLECSSDGWTTLHGAIGACITESLRGIFHALPRHLVLGTHLRIIPLLLSFFWHSEMAFLFSACPLLCAVKKKNCQSVNYREKGP